MHCAGGLIDGFEDNFRIYINVNININIMCWQLHPSLSHYRPGWLCYYIVSMLGQ